MQTRLVGSIALLAAVLVLGVTGVTTGAAAVWGRGPTLPSADTAARPVDGYPQRIPFDRPSPKLPDRPGPLAGTLYDNNFGNGRWLGVTSHGRLWELPSGVNVLSPDGGTLLSGDASGIAQRLSVHDLSTGRRRVFDDIGETYDYSLGRQFRYLVDQQSAINWTQDSSAVLARFSERPRPRRFTPRVLDVSSGVVTDLEGAEAAGFRSPSQAVTVTRLGGKDAGGGIAVTTTDLGTGGTQVLDLLLAGPWRGGPDTDLGASVSPDGSTLLLVEAPDFPRATLRLFSLSDGRELAPRRLDDVDSCPPTWLGDDPVVPTESHQAGAALVTPEGPRPLVAVHHRMQSSCLQLTPAALAAGPHPALLGTLTSRWTWYWEPALALSLAALGLAWLGWHRRARRPGGAPDPLSD